MLAAPLGSTTLQDHRPAQTRRLTGIPERPLGRAEQTTAFASMNTFGTSACWRLRTTRRVDAQKVR